MASLKDAYLSLLRWDTPLHILIVAGIGCSALSPWPAESTALVLFFGMIVRTRSCGIRPSGIPPGLGWGYIVLVRLCGRHLDG